MQGRACQGAGGEFVPRTSRTEKRVLKMWNEMLDHAAKERLKNE